ncbi:MAG: sigma 54-interacting transcriptional regulator [Planctomycetota bacterium]
MTAFKDLLAEDRFLHTMFETVPCSVLVVDTDRRIQAVNNVMVQTFGVDAATAIAKRGGEALGCIHAHDAPEGCGYGEACTGCEVRRTALEALDGNQVHRHRAQVELAGPGRTEGHTLLVSAAPMEYSGRKYAVILLEDITELATLRRRLNTEHVFRGLVGRDPQMRALFDSIRELAGIDVPVLIQGETGTGKELVASALHNEGPRRDKLFVPVNCGALPENLLESELFGHVRGAFTGAVRDKKGRFELADGGTIFLDEVGDISAAMQVKILRVLELGTFERVGSETTQRVDIRVLSATNKNLMCEVARGKFRKDLYYRLAVVPITLPPLRDRRGDIPLLAEHILARAAEANRRTVPHLAPETLEVLMAYDWPGNVRELQNWLQYALVQCREETILPAHLPPEYQAVVHPHKRTRKRKLAAAAVRRALADSNGNKVAAARALGVGRATLYRFMEDTGTGTEGE